MMHKLSTILLAVALSMPVQANQADDPIAIFQQEFNQRVESGEDAIEVLRSMIERGVPYELVFELASLMGVDLSSIQPTQSGAVTSKPSTWLAPTPTHSVGGGGSNSVSRN